jgi:GxxExxY protein
MGGRILKVAIAIHREIGCGLMESVYQAVLADELKNEGFTVEKEKIINVVYRGRQIDAAFRADLIVEGRIILELKSVEKVSDVHRKQLLTYLKLSGLRLGYLLNFGEAVMKTGITRIVNQLPDEHFNQVPT